MAEKPTSVDGGCLCGSVRYTVTFPATHDWDDCIGTCQCSSCRKITGSLLFRFHQVPREAVTFHSDATLSTYCATPGKHRGFCRSCGSYLFYRGEGSRWINLAVGCFDKEPLAKYGPLLTKQGANLYCCNEIVGVTDHLTGERFDTQPGE